VVIPLTRRPLGGARETLQWLRDLGVSIFYVTGRNENRWAETSAWLEHFGFPPGAGAFFRSEPAEPTRVYKTRVIRKIQEKHRVLFGVGDKRSDVWSYQACGIVAIRLGSDWARARAWIAEILKVEEILGPEITENDGN